jgi:type VI protein secretion system component Hcp
MEKRQECQSLRARNLRYGVMAVAAMSVGFLGAVPASANYIGPAYIHVPGVAGDAKEESHRGWVKTEAHYWGSRARAWFFGAGLLTVSGPMAPATGASQLSVAVSKNSQAYKLLMAKCVRGEMLPEITFSENSSLARNPLESGPMPPQLPPYYQYTLKNVKLACPVAADAPEQAFVFKFDNIEWTNAQPAAQPRDVTAITRPASLSAPPRTGATKVAVLTWLAGAVDANPNQCPKMNTKPPQEAYFRYLTPERAAEQREVVANKGGVDANLMPFRAPGELDATMLPGTVGDPGFFAPKAEIVPGLNLDGDDGTGKPPKGIRKHKNFVSPAGEKGVDNQMFLVEGCVAGWRRNGFLPLISNDMRASGELSILVRVSGIDNEQNDDEIAVDLLYSRDGMKRVGPAKVLLSGYTYRVSDKIDDTNAFARFRGKIVNGVIVTDPVDKISLHYSNTSALNVYKPRLRLEFKSDGSMKGIMGGYRDWREYIAYAFLQKGQYEATIGYDSASMYHAIRSAADGMQDPVTGEYLGISTAWDLEGVSAYIPPEQEMILAGTAPNQPDRVRRPQAVSVR